MCFHRWFNILASHVNEQIKSPNLVLKTLPKHGTQANPFSMESKTVFWTEQLWNLGLVITFYIFCILLRDCASELDLLWARLEQREKRDFSLLAMLFGSLHTEATISTFSPLEIWGKIRVAPFRCLQNYIHKHIRLSSAEIQSMNCFEGAVDLLMTQFVNWSARYLPKYLQQLREGDSNNLKCNEISSGSTVMIDIAKYAYGTISVLQLSHPVDDLLFFVFHHPAIIFIPNLNVAPLVVAQLRPLSVSCTQVFVHMCLSTGVRTLISVHVSSSKGFPHNLSSHLARYTSALRMGVINNRRYYSCLSSTWKWRGWPC